MCEFRFTFHLCHLRSYVTSGKQTSSRRRFPVLEIVLVPADIAGRLQGDTLLKALGPGPAQSEHLIVGAAQRRSWSREIAWPAPSSISGSSSQPGLLHRTNTSAFLSQFTLLARMAGSCVNGSRREKQHQEEKSNEKGEFFCSFIAIKRVSFISTHRNPASLP